MAAPATDPYAILGVDIQASDDDLDHAFRRLVRQLHPDTRTTAQPPGPADSSRFDDADRRLQELLTAYATLRDPKKRAAYDRGRTATATNGDAPRPRPAASRVGPAIRVGPVHWSASRTTTDIPTRSNKSHPMRRSSDAAP